MQLKVIAATAALGTVLSGCAGNMWAPGPNAVGTFDEASASCRIAASGDRTSVYAQGSPGYVAGAVTGAAIGDAIRQADDFNNCMLARGWVITGKNDKETMEAQKAEATSILSDMKQCGTNVRNNPKYIALQPYLADATTRHYTLNQKANQHFATAAEAAVLSDYAGDSAKCLDAHLDAIAKLDPRSAARVRSLQMALDNLQLLVIEKKLNWGDYSQAAEATFDAAQAGQPLPPPPAMSENAAR